jgi:hypothetical protein
MRFMITFRMPTDTANAAIKEGRIPQSLQSIMEELQPEAAYFTVVDGARGGHFIVNIDTPAQLPAMLEPLYLALGARIDVQLALTPEDFEQAAPGIEQARQKYG